MRVMSVPQPHRDAQWLAVAVLVVLGLLMSSPRRSEAADYRGTIVDADTGQPLQGVVIFAAWFRRYTGIVHGWVGNDYYASEETESGPDGKFVLRDRSTWTLLPFITKIDGPQFIIFKPGYGHWRFQGSLTWPSMHADLYERQARVDDAWRRFKGSGANIELPRPLTREDRLGSLPHRPLDVPRAGMVKLLEAINRERSALGLEPESPSEESSKDAKP